MLLLSVQLFYSVRPVTRLSSQISAPGFRDIRDTIIERTIGNGFLITLFLPVAWLGLLDGTGWTVLVPKQQTWEPPLDNVLATQRRGASAMTPDTRAFSSRSSTRTPPAVVRPWRCCSCRKPRNAEQHQVDHSEKSHYSGRSLCNPTRPPPARRRRSISTSSLKQSSFLVGGQDGLMGSSRIGFWRSFMLASLVGLLFLCQGVQAGVYENVFGVEEILPGELLFDRSAPPSLHMNLEQRDESTYSYEPSTTTIRPSSTSGSASKASGTLAVATQTAMASLPRPFDSSLGNNFTSTTCPTFFNHFLNNQTFKDCLPLSLLLQVSIFDPGLSFSTASY